MWNTCASFIMSKWIMCDWTGSAIIPGNLRHSSPARKLLYLNFLNDNFLTFQIVCLSRLEKDPQHFYIQYDNGDIRQYSSNERDLILASLLDGIRASGNDKVLLRSVIDIISICRYSSRGINLTAICVLYLIQKKWTWKENHSVFDML